MVLMPQRVPSMGAIVVIALIVLGLLRRLVSMGAIVVIALIVLGLLRRLVSMGAIVVIALILRRLDPSLLQRLRYAGQQLRLAALTLLRLFNMGMALRRRVDTLGRRALVRGGHLALALVDEGHDLLHGGVLLGLLRRLVSMGCG